MKSERNKSTIFGVRVVLLLIGGLGAWFLYELRGERSWIQIAAALTVIALLAAIMVISRLTRKGRVAPQVSEGLSLLATSLLLGLFCLELLLRLALPLLPMSVRQLANEADTEKARNAMCETLDGAPFVKFRPNMTVRSMGERGSDFVYEWQTDSLGFKNPPAMLDSGIFAVAMGDSFTEGMGVAIPDTWPSQLTNLGYATYNLATQGNSLTQMLGSLTRYGLQMKPKVCLIGYTASIFSREAAYTIPHKNAMAAELRTKHEIKRLNRLVLLALPRAVMQYINNEATAPSVDAQIVHPSMQSWKREILDANYARTDQIEQEAEWNAALIRIAQINQACKEIGASTLLLYFPHRQTAYFTKATGKDLPSNFFEPTESALMARYAAQLGLPFLNLTHDFVAYTNALQDAPQDSDLPFLRFDGHPSPQGQALIAKAVFRELGRLGYKPALGPR